MNTQQSLKSFMIIVIGIILAVIYSGFFIVNEGNQAITLQFGELNKIHTDPGLKFKVPFIQDVWFFEKRVIEFDSTFIDVKTVDRKRLFVNAYVLYKIKDVANFYRTVRPANEYGTKARLETIVPSSIKNVLGRIPLRDLLSPKRHGAMTEIRSEIKRRSEPLGLEVIDVRIVRTELPEENRPAVYERFKQSLVQTAKGNRAEGEEKSRTIKASADRECVILLAQANKKSQEIKGKGDSLALKVANEAYKQDPEFYSFYRSLETYKKHMNTDVEMILSSEHPYLKYMLQTPKN
ncbi:MAG: protease modulator HflC [Candidatus Puniceispirillum sp.]|nr:protease modulator HflC [Candidatus Pelagibacter sp.]MBA4283584.1 protease modulator HflC [Candidatus Puniceispirillum sp.]